VPAAGRLVVGVPQDGVELHRLAERAPHAQVGARVLEHLDRHVVHEEPDGATVLHGVRGGRDWALPSLSHSHTVSVAGHGGGVQGSDKRGWRRSPMWGGREEPAAETTDEPREDDEKTQLTVKKRMDRRKTLPGPTGDCFGNQNFSVCSYTMGNFWGMKKLGKV
jgi:hypothetical protein